ncbi:hypothetical protein [Agromyces sp. NPDC058126]|uniref:hypothetical protein n=1 Tax=Agromyces sp. NPDC058126 TaxID=3346350 RepID=UPI0036DCFA3D
MIWGFIGVVVLLLIIVMVRALRVRREPPAEDTQAARAERDRFSRERRLEREADDPGPPISGAGLG